MSNPESSRGKKLLIVLGIVLIVAAVIYGAVHNTRKVNNNPNACINRTFTLGDQGNCINDAQQLLNWYQYGNNPSGYLRVTGIYTPPTSSAVTKAQKSASLKVNGQLDPETWTLLCRGYNPPAWWISAAKNAGCPSV